MPETETPRVRFGVCRLCPITAEHSHPSDPPQRPLLPAAAATEGDTP